MEILLLFVAAFICEFIDCSLGMGYGTILSPLLIIFGYSPLEVVPAILISQALGGLSASVFHHRYKNSVFKINNNNSKIVFIISVLGVFAACLSSFIGSLIPKHILTTYIGILVLVMGIIILFNFTFRFTWNKIIALGILSAFNKGLSGGGFGPIVTAGQIISGRGHKESIGVTTLSEVPICFCGFLTYIIVGHFNSNVTIDYELISCLILGSILSTPFGAYLTKFLPKTVLKYIVALLIIVLGAWTLAKTWL